MADQRRFELAALRTAAGEAAAFARQAALLCRDVRTSQPFHAAPGSNVVVLVHGLFASAGVLRPLRSAIEAATGARTATFSYVPGPGVSTLSDRLASLVASVGGDARVHLVGHSLGGVVVRWYASGAGVDQRVCQTISLASPFGGTRHARFLPTAAGRDISPESRLLAELATSPARVPHFSILAERDALITEPAHVAGCDGVVVPGCGHNGLLYEPRTAELVIARIRAAAASLAA